MNISAMLAEPMRKAPYVSMSSSSSSPTQQRLPSLVVATSQHEPHASRPLVSTLPSLSSLSSLPSLPPQPQSQVHRMDSTSSTGSYVNASIQAKALPNHQRHHSTDSIRRESSASSSYAGPAPRHRGKQTKAACIPCRKRKSKCDGIRPSCKSCVGKVTACEYSVIPGVTQQQAVKNQLDAYKHVLNLLRQGNAADCEVLIKQLKAHELLADAVGDIMQTQILERGSSRPGA